MSVVFDLSLCPVFPAGAAAPVPATGAADAFRAWLDTEVGASFGVETPVKPRIRIENEVGCEDEVGASFRTCTGIEERGTETSPDLVVRWPLQAPPVQPIELITIRLADQPAVDDEIATEAEADQDAPEAAPIPFLPAVPVPVPDVRLALAAPSHQPALATVTVKPAVSATPAVPEVFAAPDIAIGHAPVEPRPVAVDVEVDQEVPAQAAERRPAAAARRITMDIPIEIFAEPTVPPSVPAAFTRMPFADLPPAVRAALPQVERIDPKWRSPWAEAPVAPATAPVSAAQLESFDREPQDDRPRQSFRNLQVPAAILRLATRDGIALSREADAAELVATVRDIARPSAALASLMVAAKAAAPQGDVTWTPMALTMAATPFARTAEAAPAVAFAEALPTFSPDTVEQTVDHIVRTISLAWARGRAEAQIRLNPNHFGEVAVSVKVESGRVVVRLEAEAAVVREWLRANQPALSAALVDRELHLEQLEVSAPREESDSTSREQAQSRQSGQQAARRAKRDQPGQLFEVVE